MAGPGELDVRQNRKQIGDSPDRPVRTAAAQDISQQVDVKTEKDKEGGESFLFRKGIARGGKEKAEIDIVGKNVMILAVEVQARPLVLGGNAGKDPQAVGIRDDPRQGDQRPVSPLQVIHVCDQPSSQKMRCRIHIQFLYLH